MEKLYFWMFLISFLCILTLPFILGYLGKTKAMAGVISACAIAMAFSQIDKLELFKGMGFEARMKKFVEEESIKNLQKISTTLASCVLDVMIAEGRAGAIKWENKKQMYDNLFKRLRGLGLNDEQLKELKESSLWDKYLLLDHVFIIEHKYLLSKIPNAKYSAIRAKIDKDLFIPEKYYVANASQFRKLFNEFNLLTPEIEESIKDLEYFQEKKELRRPEFWGSHY